MINMKGDLLFAQLIIVHYININNNKLYKPTRSGG